jgi:excisionase family DNA binding protein
MLNLSSRVFSEFLEVLMREFLTAGEIARTCRVSDETVRNWARAGRLKSIRIGRKFLFDKSDVELLFDGA